VCEVAVKTRFMVDLAVIEETKRNQNIDEEEGGADPVRV
jgi:hypothetical protein